MPEQATTRNSNGISFECRPSQKVTIGEGDVRNNAMGPKEVVVTLFRDGERLENVERRDAAAMKTYCGSGLGVGVARVVKALRKKCQGNDCFFSKEDGD